MVKIQGITVELNGDTTGLNDALKSVDKQTKSVQSELKQVDRLLKFDPSNVELLSQKQQLLGDAVNSTSQRLDALKQAQAEVERQFANGDIGADQYRAFQREIIATEGQLQSLNRQLDSVDARLEIDTDTSALDRMQNELRDVAETAKKVGKGIGDGLKKGAEVGAKAVAGIGIAAAGAVAGVGAFVESQKEMSTDLARLKTNAEVAGFSLGAVEEGFMKVAAVSGEADSAIEAMSNLMATDMSENQLAEMLDYVNGAAIKFSDTLKTEGIADGIQESFAVGEATGALAELLERSGVNLEVFNKGLATASKTGTETDYVLQQLSELGLKSTYDAYLENNSAIADYNLAQVESQKKLAEFSDVLRPFVTTLMEMGNIILDVVLGNKDLATGFGELVTIISELGTKFMNAAKDAMPKFIEGIQSALPKLLEAGIGIVAKLAEGVGTNLPALTGKGLELIEKLASTLIANLPKLLDAGVKFVTSLISGIASNLPKLVTTALNLVLKLVSTIISNLPKIIEAGVKILTSIVSGLGKALPQLVTYLVGTFIPKLVKTITGADWKQIGKDIINGLIKGIGSMTKSAIEAITGVVGSVVGAAKKLLGINSPSKVFTQIGKWTGEGLAIGLDDSQTVIEKSMADIGYLLIDAAEHFAEEEKKIAKSSTSEIAKIKKNASDKIVDLEEKAQNKILAIKNKAAKSKKGITQNEKNQIISIQKDLAKSIEKVKTDSSDKIEKLQANSVKNQITTAEKSYKEYLSVIQNYISDKKSLDQLSLVEEAKIWENSIALFDEGTDERIKAQQEYAKASEALNKEIEAINKEHTSEMNTILNDTNKAITEINGEYDKELSKRTEFYKNFKSTFDEFVVDMGVSGDQLTANLQSQVDGFKLWQETFDSLIGRGILSDELSEELADLGVNALPQLLALNSMTDEQLTNYSNLYDEKSKSARERAETELIGMRQDADVQIEELKKTAQKKLDELNSRWQKSIQTLTNNTRSELGKLHQIGADAGQGLLNGLSSMQSPLIEKAQEIANAIASTIQSALDIHSPSRVMKGFGINIGEGLIMGMDEMINKVAASSDRLSGAVVNAQNSLSTSAIKSREQGLIPSNSTKVDNSRTFAPVIHNYGSSKDTRTTERMLKRLAIQFN